MAPPTVTVIVTHNTEMHNSAKFILTQVRGEATLDWCEHWRITGNDCSLVQIRLLLSIRSL
jgi:hypothetical protein